MGLGDWILRKGPGSPGYLTRSACKAIKNYLDLNQVDNNSHIYRRYVGTLLHHHFLKYSGIEVPSVNGPNIDLLEELRKIIDTSVKIYCHVHVRLYNFDRYSIFNQHQSKITNIIDEITEEYFPNDNYSEDQFYKMVYFTDLLYQNRNSNIVR